MHSIKIYNTLTKQKEDFQPIDINHIKVYTCGPTVYNYAHIGNARPAIISDVIIRLLRLLYPKVTYVSNITDIDDKIINAAKKDNCEINIITDKYEKIYNKNLLSLGVIKPDFQPRATEHISEMLDIISKLIKDDYAYFAEGHVLFNVKKYPLYGKLSGRNIEEQIIGSRVEIAPYKKNPIDFVLWKPSTDKQPGWDSPWGFGRPGWHLECSAMSQKTLGLPFDIHGGGLDLTFPHHENEIAQSCSVLGKLENPAAYAKYWIHNGMLHFDGEKMSKSVGNTDLINDLLDKYPGDVLRLAMLSTHYRQPLNWNEKALLQAKASMARINRIVGRLSFNINKDKLNPSNGVVSALSDDFNTPKALGEFNILINRFSQSEKKDQKALRNEILSSAYLLGLFQNNPKGIKKTSYNDFDTKIEGLIQKRNEARSESNYDLADKIRKELNEIGIDIEDTIDGTRWKKK